jgi:hypothetical protein
MKVHPMKGEKAEPAAEEQTSPKPTDEEVHRENEAPEPEEESPVAVVGISASSG